MDDDVKDTCTADSNTGEESSVGQVLRSKGFFWLCTRPSEMMVDII